MKRFLLIVLNKIASFVGWKWLYFFAGIGLLSSIQSCKKQPVKKCYSPVRVDDEIEQTKCYDYVESPDSNEVKIIPDSSSNEDGINKIPETRTCYVAVIIPDTISEPENNNEENE